MGHNWHSFLWGEFFFLIGFGIALLGAFSNLFNPWMAYYTYLTAFAFSLYGAYRLVVCGLIAGVGYEPLNILRASIVMIQVGIVFFFLPSIFGWPMFIEGSASPFGPTFTMFVFGLIQLLFGGLSVGIVSYAIYQRRKLPPKEHHRFLKSYREILDEE